MPNQNHLTAVKIDKETNLPTVHTYGSIDFLCQDLLGIHRNAFYQALKANEGKYPVFIKDYHIFKETIKVKPKPL